MRILRWLFGKQDKTTAAVHEEPTPAGEAREQSSSVANSQPRAADPETDNLRRWRESGQARAWVETHQGRWDHNDWLALLDELKRSSFWPMHPDAVGLTLEEIQREGFRR
ncbi:MAG TPA: hypothetical protein VH575_08615 [Gemmataceae bacterium]